MEKNKLKKYSDYFIENSAVILGEVTGGILGNIGIPVISNTIMNYRQKRFERNINLFLNKIAESQKQLEKKFEKLDRERLLFIENSILPITLDYVTNEKQQEKIQHYFNGFKKIILEGVNIIELNEQLDAESLIILYYDILKEMTVFDILMFKKIVSEIRQPDGISSEKTVRTLNKEDLLEITTKYSINKLIDLRVIISPFTYGEFTGKDEYTVNLDEIKLTAIGEKLYNFIFD